MSSRTGRNAGCRGSEQRRAAQDYFRPIALEQSREARVAAQTRHTLTRVPPELQEVGARLAPSASLQALEGLDEIVLPAAN